MVYALSDTKSQTYEHANNVSATEKQVNEITYTRSQTEEISTVRFRVKKDFAFLLQIPTNESKGGVRTCVHESIKHIYVSVCIYTFICNKRELYPPCFIFLIFTKLSYKTSIYVCTYVGGYVC